MDPTFDPYVTDDLKADPVAWPILEKMPEKSITEVLKGYAHSQHRLGSSVSLPNGKPEDVAKWQAEHLPKLQQAGLIPTPTKPPEKYEVKLPEGVPAEAWGDADTELAQGFAKKHGLSQEALNDGIAVAMSVLGKHATTVQVNRQAAIANITDWAAKEGVTLEQVNSAVQRYINDPNNGWDDATKQAMSDSGHADNPAVVKALWKIAKDSGQFDTRNDGGSMDQAPAQDQAAALAEANAIIRDKTNPKYALYHRGDRDTQAYVEQLMKKGVPGNLEI